MTTIPNPDDPDTEGKAVPPYDGRQKSGEVGGPEETTQDGAHTCLLYTSAAADE